MNSKKVYISGPITGHDYEEVKKNFERAEEYIRRCGHEPVSPVKFVPESIRQMPDSYKKWLAAMRVCIKELSGCDWIYFLNYWRTSRGALGESQVSSVLDMRSFFETDDGLEYGLPMNPDIIPKLRNRREQ